MLAPRYLDKIALRLNTRPRKTLGYRTPAVTLARTLRPILVENLILSLIAGGGGLLLAGGVVQLLRTMTPFDVPRLAEGPS